MGSERVSEKGPGEYREKDRRRGRIRASVGKVEIRASTKKVGSRRVPRR